MIKDDGEQNWTKKKMNDMSAKMSDMICKVRQCVAKSTIQLEFIPLPLA